MGPDAILHFCWVLSPLFHSPLSHLSKRLFLSCLFSAIRVVSSAYLRLLISLPAILITACASSSPVFLMMYSANQLNKQGDNIQPWRTPFPICNQSVVPCPVLTVPFWPAYRFLKRQVRWSGSPISFRMPKATELQKLSLTPGTFCSKSLFSYHCSQPPLSLQKQGIVRLYWVLTW